MTILSLIFVAIGLFFLVWSKSLAQWLYDLHRPLFKTTFSWLIDVDAPWFRKSYDIAMVGIGVMLLIGAYFTYFGPITS
ncbi:MAG: hypothetical protein UY63_C0008G0003 [Parcubacteria group bacterium GW2011_GWA2_51_10]|nr:MAG: hypothetical protein UY63_C0008G0003 [Parcubacteria group bacterium GW2011_GWA2_51_10]